MGREKEFVVAAGAAAEPPSPLMAATKEGWMKQEVTSPRSGDVTYGADVPPPLRPYGRTAPPPLRGAGGAASLALRAPRGAQARSSLLAMLTLNGTLGHS